MDAPWLQIDCLVCSRYATDEYPAAAATVIAEVKGGCHVVLNEIQPLCEQHWITCEPLGKGGATVLIELTKKN